MYDIYTIAIYGAVILLLVGALSFSIPRIKLKIDRYTYDNLKLTDLVITKFISPKLSERVQLKTITKGSPLVYRTSLLLSEGEICLPRDRFVELLTLARPEEAEGLGDRSDEWLIDKLNGINAIGGLLIAIGGSYPIVHPKFVLVNSIRMGGSEAISVELCAAIGGDCDVDSTTIRIIHPHQYSVIYRP